MRILFVTPFLPSLAATHGGGIYVASLAAAMARQAELGLCALLNDAESKHLQDDPAWWRWTATANRGDRPARAVARRLHQVRMAWHWRSLPLFAAKCRRAHFPAALQRALREFRPDAAFVELGQMAQYLPHLGGVPTVLTDHDTGCPANTDTGLGRWANARDHRLWRHYVQRFYPLASHVQALTPQDAAELSTLLERPVGTRNPAFALPPAAVDPGAAPPRALFLGDYRHDPNPQAARRLVQEVLPRLRAADPAFELWLAGPGHNRIADVPATPGLRVLGAVPDLTGLFAQVRVMLSPLWSGGGFRVKNFTALAHGLPVVTNELGRRGCTAPAPALAVADDLTALSQATLRLLRSPDEARLAGQAARRWALANLDDDAVAQDQLELAARLCESRTR